MQNATKQELEALVALTRKHLEATEQAVKIGSLPDVLMCTADLMDAAAKMEDNTAKAALDD